MKAFYSISWLFFLIAFCCTPDKLYLHVGTYAPPLNPPINFEGYYCQSCSQASVQINDGFTGYSKECKNKIGPIFFYRDGTVLSPGCFCNIDSLYYWVAKGTPAPWSWGTFDFRNDTLLLEFYWPSNISLTYERYYLKGIINQDSLVLFQFITREWKKKSIHSVYYASEDNSKPDSSLSTLKPINKLNQSKHEDIWNKLMNLKEIKMDIKNVKTIEPIKKDSMPEDSTNEE